MRGRDENIPTPPLTPVGEIYQTTHREREYDIVNADEQ
jgi:hypothetical protein